MKEINYIKLKNQFLKAEKRDSENKRKKRKNYLIYGLAIPIIIGLNLSIPLIFLAYVSLILVILVEKVITIKEYNERHTILKNNIKMINIPLEYPHILIEMIDASSSNKTLAEYRFLKKAYDLKADMIVAVNLNNNKSTSVTSSSKRVESTTYDDFLYTGTAIKIDVGDVGA